MEARTAEGPERCCRKTNLKRKAINTTSPIGTNKRGWS